MRVVNGKVMRRVVGVVWAGCAVAVFGLLMVPGAHAATLNPELLPQVKAATFEVVSAKPTHDPLTYAKPLPMDLIPYQQRTDKYHSIGTAFAIGPNKFVTAGHVLRAGLNSLWGPLELRDAKGHVYAIGKIEKFSLRKDFVVFSLQDPPKHLTTLALDTHPVINQSVFAVGNALGTGIVIRGGLYTSNTPENQSGAWKWIRFSAAASPGNSGGPLLDDQGKVIGVVLMKSPDENLNYALPISQVVKAPADEAVIDKLIPYGFDLFNDTLSNHFKARFKLPMSLADFNAAYLKYMHHFEESQLKAILAQNASRLFPRGEGSARLLYTARWDSTVPVLLTRTSTGDWVAHEKSGRKIHLDDKGYLKVGLVGHNILFHLHAPDNMPVSQLHREPIKLMNLLAKAGFLKRHIGSAKIKVTSLGKPDLDITHVDAWQRRWQIMQWPIAYGNGYVAVCVLPVPDGYAGYLRFYPASQKHDYLINLEAMTNFVYVNYAGTLAQWQAFLKQPKLLPAAFKKIHLDVHDGKRLSYASRRLAMSVTNKQVKVDATSWLYLGFGFSRINGKVVWGVDQMQLSDHYPDGNNWVAVTRNSNPAGNPSESYAHLWTQLLQRHAPFDLVAYPHDGQTRMASVIGGKVGSKPAVLYAMTYTRNGSHPQSFMKAGLDALIKGVQIHEP